MTRPILAATFVVAAMIALPAAAQDAGTPTSESLSAAYTGKVYSPYAHRAFPERPLWGDSHLHTALSLDAGLFGNRLPPLDAYRFARGEEVVSSTGQPVRLSRPLDWLVVADHSDGLGVFGDIASGKPALLAYEQAARWNRGLTEGGDAAVQAAGWTYGGLVNHVWSVAGDDDRADINATFLQPFVSFTNDDAWTFSLQSETVYDWESEEWAVPINIAVSKLLAIGGLPISIQGGLRYWAESANSGPEGLGFRLGVTFLFLR